MSVAFILGVLTGVFLGFAVLYLLGFFELLLERMRFLGEKK